MELKGKFLDIDLRTTFWKVFPKNAEQDMKLLILLASSGFTFLQNDYLYIRDYKQFPVIINYKKRELWYVTGAMLSIPDRDSTYNIILTYDFLVFYCSKKYLF